MNRYHRWRFVVVLLATLLFTAVQPIVSDVNDYWVLNNTFFSVLIGAVSLSLLEEKTHRRTALGLAMFALLTTWLSHGFEGWLSRAILISGHLCAALFFSLVLYRILEKVLIRRVSRDAIFGAICGYLLLGIIWGLVYSSLETFRPGSFNISETHAVQPGNATQNHDILRYYSFVTLTTLGYGDITPTTPTARTLSWLEAMTGQFYLAVLVAGLVGLHVTRSVRKKEKEKSG